ncbi:MAG: hypothetical protein QXN63_00395 [Candidatus Bathyarchaeia archaeon]
MVFNNKGQIKVMEAFLSVLLITSALTLSARLSPTPKTQSNEFLETMGWQTLTKLDEEGSLSQCINEKNWSKLREAVQILLPLEVSFNLTVFDEAMTPINDVPISNGLSGDEIVAVQYPCAVPYGNCQFYLIRLQLALTK